MKTQGWKRDRRREPVSPEIQKARVWIALAIGAACGIAMAFATNVAVGVIVGAMFFGFLMIRRGRVS